VGVVELEEALRLIEGNAGGFFKGEIPEELIAKAELFLGVKFPESYKVFLRKKGCGSFLSKEFYGISSDKFENGSVPNSIWLTGDERKTSKLNHGLVLIGQSFEGYYALDTSRIKDNECPVVDALPVGNSADFETVATDFGTFFLKQVQEVL